MRRIFILLLLAGAAGAHPAEISDQPDPSKLRVERRDFFRVLTFSGEIRAAQAFNILSPSVSSKWNFTVTFLLPEGTEVAPGDVVAAFDASDLELLRLDLEKNREEARLKIAQKEAEIEGRRQDLLLQMAQARKDAAVAGLYVDIDSNLIPRADAEKYRFDHTKAVLGLEKAQERMESLGQSAEAELEVVRLEYEQADLELKRILGDLERMRARAPSPGLILYQDNWSTGRKLQVGDQIHKGQPLMLIPNLEQLVVEAQVHHSDLMELEAEAPVEVVLDAYPQRIFRGRIDTLPEIARSRSYQARLKTFALQVWLEDQDHSVMKPGMTARVRLSRTIPQALVVPRAALSFDDQGTFVLDDAVPPKRVAVQVVETNQEWAAIEGDLRPGQALSPITAGGVGASEAPLEWITIGQEKLAFHVSGSGLLQARQSVYISPPSVPNTWSFKIVRLAPEGIRVKPGDFLVQFDATDFLQRLRVEQANLDKVTKELEKNHSSFQLEREDLELQLEQARFDKEKAANKLMESVSFNSNLDVRKAEFEAAFTTARHDALEKKLKSLRQSQDLQVQILRDKIEFYRARVQANQQSLQQLTVTAPSEGVLVYQTNWNQEKKQVGDQAYLTENIFSIPDLSTLRIEGQVSEIETGRLRLGQSVSVTLDALPEEVFKGRLVDVGSIFRRAASDRAAKILDVVVELDAADEARMRPGMAARLQIAVDEFNDVIAVPLAVIQAQAGESFVWVRQGQEVSRRNVTVGKDNGIVAIIEKGLKVGDEVASHAPAGSR